MKTLPRARLLVALLSMAAVAAAQAQYAKLDGPLSDLVDSLQPGAAARQQSRAAISEVQSTVLSSAMTDDIGRVLVDIYLDGSVSLPQFLSQLQGVGANVTGANPDFRFGAISAYLPTAAISSISVSSGLHLMKLTLAPHRNVGAVTSQGTKVIRSDVANTNGFIGTGITVGVLSDSYDGSATDAAQ